MATKEHETAASRHATVHPAAARPHMENKAAGPTHPAAEPARGTSGPTHIAADDRKAQVHHPVQRPPSEDQSSDHREGIVRDPVRWNGQIVSYVKDIGVADREYDASVKKVMIQLPGGVTQIVPEVEILRSVAPRSTDFLQADRDPTKTFPKGHPGDVTQSSTRKDTVNDLPNR